MNFADAADIASVLLERAPREQLDALIERRDPEQPGDRAQPDPEPASSAA